MCDILPCMKPLLRSNKEFASAEWTFKNFQSVGNIMVPPPVVLTPEIRISGLRSVPIELICITINNSWQRELSSWSNSNYERDIGRVPGSQ